MRVIEDSNQIWDLKKDILQSGASVKIKLTGTSMYPYLKKGDIGYYKFVAPEFLKPGDIIAFEQDGCFITHRIIRNSNLIITRGDACLNFDKPVDKSHIIGKLLQIERNGKMISISSPCRVFLNKLFATHRIFIRLYAKFAMIL